MSQSRTELEELVAATSEDWSDLGWVYSTCMDRGETSPTAVRDLALRTIEEGLSGGLLVAGDVTADGFRAWDLGPAAVERIRTAWLNAPQVIPVPDAVWFDLTPDGEALAQRHLRARGATNSTRLPLCVDYVTFCSA